MIGIRYELDKKQLRSVERDLEKLRSRMPKVLSRTVDKTATSARMLLVKGMQDTYTIKSTGAKKGMAIKKASDQDPTATIEVSGGLQPSIRFRHSKGGRDGVKLQVRTDDPFKAIKPIEGRKAFIAQMASGHKGIPYTQLPYESGAEYLGEKLALKDFTWRAVEGGAGWVGTRGPDANVSEYLYDLTEGRWTELLTVPDLDRLYNTYVEKSAERRMILFNGLRFTAFVKIGANGVGFEYRIFADGNLGESEAAEVAFWPYLLRKGKPSF